MAGAKNKKKTSTAASKKPTSKKLPVKQSQGKATPAKSPKKTDDKATPEKIPRRGDVQARHTVKKSRVSENDLEQLREKIKLEETLIKGLKKTVEDRKYDGLENGPQKVARSLRDSMQILSETSWCVSFKMLAAIKY